MEESSFPDLVFKPLEHVAVKGKERMTLVVGDSAVPFFSLVPEPCTHAVTRARTHTHMTFTQTKRHALKSAHTRTHRRTDSLTGKENSLLSFVPLPLIAVRAGGHEVGPEQCHFGPVAIVHAGF